MSSPISNKDSNLTGSLSSSINASVGNYNFLQKIWVLKSASTPATKSGTLKYPENAISGDLPRPPDFYAHPTACSFSLIKISTEKFFVVRLCSNERLAAPTSALVSQFLILVGKVSFELLPSSGAQLSVMTMWNSSKQLSIESFAFMEFVWSEMSLVFNSAEATG